MQVRRGFVPDSATLLKAVALWLAIRQQPTTTADARFQRSRAAAETDLPSDAYRAGNMITERYGSIVSTRLRCRRGATPGQSSHFMA